MGFLNEGVAVITGAGSGMGRSLAQQLAGLGASLAISDVDEKGLAETAALLGSAKGKVTQHIVNVADEAQMKAFAEDVEAKHGGPRCCLITRVWPCWGNLKSCRWKIFGG